MSSLNSDITKQHNIRISQVSPRLYRSERSYKEKKDPVIGTKNLIDYCFSLAKGGWDSEEYREEFMAKAYAKAKELKLTK